MLLQREMRVAAPAARVWDALWDVEAISTPERVWRALRQAGGEPEP